jgi:hypothetical protein
VPKKASIFRSAKGRIGEPDGFTRRLPKVMYALLHEIVLMQTLNLLGL